jgi:hypothetical protein
MLARDINSNPTQYRTWVVANTPDFNAQFYTGYKSSNNAFVDLTAYAINDDSVIANFNLPYLPNGILAQARRLLTFPFAKFCLLL